MSKAARRKCTLRATAIGLLLAAGCGPSQYNYSFPTKGGAQRFPKHVASASAAPATPDAGSDTGPSSASH